MSALWALRGEGRAPRAGPGVAAPFPLLCRQQERFIEKSWVRLMQLSVSTPSGRGLGARLAAAALTRSQQRSAPWRMCSPLNGSSGFHFLKGSPIFASSQPPPIVSPPASSSPVLQPCPVERGAPCDPPIHRVGVVGWPPPGRALGQRSLPASAAFPGLDLSFPTFKMPWLDTTWMPFNASGLWVKELICTICGKYGRV